MGAGGPQGSGRTNAGGHRSRPHRSAPIHSGPYSSGRAPTRPQQRRQARAIARTPVKRYVRPKQRVSSHTKEHVAATPKRVKRQEKRTQAKRDLAQLPTGERKKFERSYARLWRHASRFYPELHGKMPTLHVFPAGDLAQGEVMWGDKSNVFVSTAAVRDTLKHKNDFAKSIPLHEWQHNAQNAKYGKTGKAGYFTREARAETKKAKVSARLHFHRVEIQPQYREFSLDPKKTKRMDSEFEHPDRQARRYFKHRVTTPRPDGPITYNLRRQSKKGKRGKKSDIALGA